MLGVVFILYCRAGRKATAAVCSRFSVVENPWSGRSVFWIRNRLIGLQGAYLRVLSCHIESHWGAYLARLADQAPAKNSLQERT
jgi:hypothetical protein